ncbi:hypothetical protein ACIQ7Q_06965 [Streptomyces sp. NPDC096176]|uniref:hypothetical protein n=1 Tax=Streptomyces sp. NPDC096176 TaxID=3366079 RepID=UPI003816A58A
MRARAGGDEEQNEARQEEHAGHSGLEHPFRFVVLSSRAGFQAGHDPAVGRTEAGDDLVRPLGTEAIARADVGEPFGGLVKAGWPDGSGQSAVSVVDVLVRAGFPEGR